MRSRGLRTVVFAINEPGAIALRQLLTFPIQIDLVLTRNMDDASFVQVNEIARAHNIPCLTPTNLEEPAVLKAIMDCRPQLIVSSWYHLKIPSQVIQATTVAAVNFHPSLLPSYRGATPVEWMLMNGEEVAGLTCHKLVERFDSGNILWQKRIPILPYENAGQLNNRIAGFISEGFENLLHRIDKGWLEGISQKAFHQGYFKKRVLEDSIIDWTQNALAIHNKIRAMSPRPMARAFWNGKTVLFPKSELTSEKGSGRPGNIIRKVSDREYLVGCGQGEALILKEIIFPNDLPLGEKISSFGGHHADARI